MKNKEYIYVVMRKHLVDIMQDHSYILGVYEKKHEAMEAAQVEEEYRGGKYKALYCTAPLNTTIVNCTFDYLLKGKHEWTKLVNLSKEIN